MLLCQFQISNVFLRSYRSCLWELSHHKPCSLTSPVLHCSAQLASTDLCRASDHQLQLPGIKHETSLSPPPEIQIALAYRPNAIESYFHHYHFCGLLGSSPLFTTFLLSQRVITFKFKIMTF